MSSMITAMWPPSLLLAGPLADMFGVRFWYLVGGAGVIAVGLAAFLVPAIITSRTTAQSGKRPGPKPNPIFIQAVSSPYSICTGRTAACPYFCPGRDHTFLRCSGSFPELACLRRHETQGGGTWNR